MKRKTIKIGWQELIETHDVPVMPEGYSTVEMIARKKALSINWVGKIMRRARLDGKIESMKARDKDNHVVWFYKD